MVFTKEQVLEYGALVGIEVSFIVGCFEFLILEVGMIFLAMIVPWVWLRLLLIIWSIFWVARGIHEHQNPKPRSSESLDRGYDNDW